jgi:hypothetical protein
MALVGEGEIDFRILSTKARKPMEIDTHFACDRTHATVLSSAESAALLFWALLASGQITMRKVDSWQSLAEKPSDQIFDLAA